MKKMKMESNVALALVENLAPFKGDDNTVKIVVGLSGSADGTNLGSMITLTNGGAMVKKCFYVKKPSDYVEGEKYAALNVKAKEFIAYIQALGAYEKDVEVEFADSTAIFSVTGVAKLSAGLIPDEDVEPELPNVNPALKLADISFKVSDFSRLVKQGCQLTDPSCTRQVGDRIIMCLKKGVLEAYASNGKAIQKAWMPAAITFSEEAVLMSKLATDTKNLSDEDKEALGKEIAKVSSEGKLVEFVKGKGYTADDVTFAMPLSNFTAFQQAMKGSEKVSVILTQNFLYLQSGTTISAYALCSATSTAKNIDKMDLENIADACVVVDVKELLKAFSLVEVAGMCHKKKGQSVVSFSAKKDKLLLEAYDTKVSVPLVESAGELSSVGIALSVAFIRAVVNGIEGGNVTIGFPSSNMRPAIFTTGGVEGEGATCKSIILPVDLKKVQEEEEAADENESADSSDGDDEE